ncbi:MAG TPA: hypothetical protein VM282_19070 [Acidimicrobiales bacterium]|nr:hypothetical protein [Acidimicrobiales bacterium]
MCKAEFALARLLDDWDCRCPSCAAPLAHDGPTRARILRKAATVDRLEAQLVDSLSEIAAIDSSFELSIGPIVARLLRDVEWQRQLQHDLSFAHRQVDHIRGALSEWTTRLHTRPGADMASEHPGVLPDEMHELAQRLRKVGDSLDHAPQPPRRPTESSTVRVAASSLDHAAVNLVAGRGQRSELAAALADAADAITTASRDGDVPADE